MSFTWTDDLRAELLACRTYAEMEAAFPDHKLENLQRRFREFGGKIRATDDPLGKLHDLLVKSGIHPDDIAKVDRVSVKEWQSMHKDDSGNAVITDLEGASIILTPHWAEGPKWQTVQVATPANIHPRSAKYVKSKFLTGVVMPDIQFGYAHDHSTGKRIPFHDERALDVMLQIMSDLSQIDAAWSLGDGLDNAEFGRYITLPTFAEITNQALQDLHNHLAEVRGLAPYAKIKFLEGNHDRRIENYILKNAEKAYGVRQAQVDPSGPIGWPVFSVPNLVNLNHLNVEYLSGYPANIDWVNENLAVVHGDKVRSGGSTAAAVVDDERASLVFGHIHRRERADKTRRVHPERGNYKESFAISPGCLCHIDGRVPSTKGSYDLYGRPIQRAENWQQGFGVLTYEEGNGSFDFEQVSIHEGTAYFRGNRYKSSV